MSENIFGLTVAADKGLDDLQCQRLLSENRRYQEVMLQYRCALKALESRLEILNEEFSLQHDRNPIESMKSRLKSPSSIMNKMQKRGLSLDFPTMQANIMDKLLDKREIINSNKPYSLHGNRPHQQRLFRQILFFHRYVLRVHCPIHMLLSFLTYHMCLS